MISQYKGLVSGLNEEYPMIGQALVHHRNTRGKAMSFKDYPYLASLYAELPDEGADICKAVQTGLSELFICLALHHAGWKGRIVAYILPTFGARDRFVAQRINRILLASEGYRSLLPSNREGTRWDHGNNKLKRFGSGSLLFLGSNTTVDFVEFSADSLIIDEFDQCDPSNLAKARDRLRASTDPKIYRLGNPTLPNIGVCKLFDEGDQRLWYTICDRCGEWQSLDWFENIVMKDEKTGFWIPRDPVGQGVDVDRLKSEIRPSCRKCKQIFNRSNKGAWVESYKERERRSYRITRLDVLNESLTDLYKEWMLAQGNLNRLSTFYTSVLGRGFEYSGARLGGDDLRKCADRGDDLDYGGGDHYKDLVVVMGVDVGSVLNFSISIAEEQELENGDTEVLRKAVLIGACRHFEELQDLILRYHIKSLVIDSMPETRKCQELRDWSNREGVGCQVWLARFHPSARVTHESYGRKMNWRDRVVTVDRTQIMDATFEEIKNEKRIYPQDVFTVLGWIDQMRAPVRVLDSEKSRVIWTEGSSPDHYRFADVYDRIAFDLAQMSGSYSTVDIEP